MSAKQPPPTYARTNTNSVQTETYNWKKFHNIKTWLDTQAAVGGAGTVTPRGHSDL